MVGARVGFYRGDVKLLIEDIQALKPTIFITVPRLLNRVYDKVSWPRSQNQLFSSHPHSLVPRPSLAAFFAVVKKIVREAFGTLLSLPGSPFEKFSGGGGGGDLVIFSRNLTRVGWDQRRGGFSVGSCINNEKGLCMPTLFRKETLPTFRLDALVALVETSAKFLSIIKLAYSGWDQPKEHCISLPGEDIASALGPWHL